MDTETGEIWFRLIGKLDFTFFCFGFWGTWDDIKVKRDRWRPKHAVELLKLKAKPLQEIPVEVFGTLLFSECNVMAS